MKIDPESAVKLENGKRAVGELDCGAAGARRREQKKTQQHQGNPEMGAAAQGESHDSSASLPYHKCEMLHRQNGDERPMLFHFRIGCAAHSALPSAPCNPPFESRKKDRCPVRP